MTAASSPLEDPDQPLLQRCPPGRDEREGKAFDGVLRELVRAGAVTFLELHERGHTARFAHVVGAAARQARVLDRQALEQIVCTRSSCELGIAVTAPVDRLLSP